MEEIKGKKLRQKRGIEFKENDFGNLTIKGNGVENRKDDSTNVRPIESANVKAPK